jgi:hypothetical protein
MENKVVVHHEVLTGELGDWRLCFQWCTYVYKEPGRPDQHGYCFIWRRPDDSLQAARGQAQIPSAADMRRLTELARPAGWYERCEAEVPEVA